MIKNIVFDMGNVLLRFEPEYFIERLGVAPEDRRTLLVQVFRSLEWARMDRGSLTEKQAAELICHRLPDRLHAAVHSLTDQWDRPHQPVHRTKAQHHQLPNVLQIIRRHADFC